MLTWFSPANKYKHKHKLRYTDADNSQLLLLKFPINCADYQHLKPRQNDCNILTHTLRHCWVPKPAHFNSDRLWLPAHTSLIKKGKQKSYCTLHKHLLSNFLASCQHLRKPSKMSKNLKLLQLVNLSSGYHILSYSVEVRSKIKSVGKCYIPLGHIWTKDSVVSFRKFSGANETGFVIVYCSRGKNALLFAWKFKVKSRFESQIRRQT